MAETGGDGFQIAKGFVSVEARVNDASVTAARQKVTGAGAAGGAPGPQQAPQPAQAQPPAALGVRLADARASLAETGTQAARTLEQGFRQGLSSLSSMAVQQLKSLQNVPSPPRAATPQVQTGVSNAQIQAQSAQIVSAVSRSLGPQVAAQVGNMLRQQIAAQRATPAPQPPAPPVAPQPRTQANSGPVVNNYTTSVRIEPKFVRQLLDVIRDINQLKSRNRATR